MNGRPKSGEALDAEQRLRALRIERTAQQQRVARLSRQYFYEDTNLELRVRTVTMRQVHVAEQRLRELDDQILDARSEIDLVRG